MESLRTVITRLFADAHDNTPLNTPTIESNYQAYHGLFSRKSPKRRRFHLLHPEITQDPAIYDQSVIPVPLHTSHLDYDALVNDFMRATVNGNITEPLKGILLKYREPPFLVTKTIRLLKFLHQLLCVVPISPPGPITMASTYKPFPLGHVLEDLTLTLSLRTTGPAPTTTTPLQPPQARNDVAVYSSWIITLQFMLSCLRNNSAQHLYNAGVTTPVILGTIKHVLLELTRLTMPGNQSDNPLDALQQTCFDTGKELLELFLVRPDSTETSTPIGTVSYYDVIYSFPELYGHFLNAAPSSVMPQPSITHPSIWKMTLRYMILSIQQDPRLLDRIPTVIAINVIKHILREINTLPPNLSTLQAQCLNKGKELINLLLIGPSGDGVGVVEYYDIILALPDVYGHFLHGTFAQSVHWTMEKFINELGKRRRHLAFLMMPPDASWPLISQLSRRHEFNDLTTRTSYHMFEGDLIEFVKEGNSTNIETHFRDMLFQRASMDEFRQLAMSLTQTGLDTTLIRKAMVSKVRDVVQCIQHYSSSEQRDLPEEDHVPPNPTSVDQVRGEDIEMVFPTNIEIWELITETADQLYSFVAADFFSYEDILDDFYKLIYNDDDEPHPVGTKNHIKKDNALVWLLLQLCYIDRVSANVIAKDFEKDERLFGKLAKLFNDDQIMTKDGFSLRDLSLQCAINYHKDYIKDLSNIKQRHPSVGTSLRYSTLCFQVIAYFKSRYHSNVQTDPTVFKNLNPEEMTLVGLESHLRRDIVPYAMYVYLVPTKPDIGTLGHPTTTFVKGGSLSYKLMDLLSVNAKHRLLQVIYKMMLDSESGPRYQAATPTTPSSIPSPPSQQQQQQQQKNNTAGPHTTITCIPPHVLDVVYKLLYSAPCSAELMIKEIFDKLRRCDKLIKLKRTGSSDPNSSSLKNSDIPLPDPTLRWMHTMLQLINYRFVRFLKYSPLSAGMFHYVRYSISYLEHRQIYQVLESFVLNSTRSQVDVKLLRSLDDPNRDKPIWFAESEKLARVMVYHIARLIKTRGQADIKTEQIHRVLAHLYEYRLQWSPETLKYFPKAVQSFYTAAEEPAGAIEGQPANHKSNQIRPAVSMATINSFVSSNQSFISFIQQGITENERGLLQYFSNLEHQPLILCCLWLVAVMRASMDVFHMPSIRKLLLVIPPSRMATCVIDFIDFVLSMDYSSTYINLSFQLLDTMIWKHQWVHLNDVILALLNGNSTGERARRSFEFLRHLLLGSPEFRQRVAKWNSLEFSARSWTEEDGHDKLMAYHQAYPEYYEFEAFAQGATQTLNPPLQTPMPIYHTNVIVDFVTCMESVIAHLIEHDQHALLADLLDEYGHLFRYHQYPLSFACNVLLYYHEAPTLRDHPLLVKRIARLLDFDQYDIAPEAVAYVTEDSVDPSSFNSTYFDRIIYKLSGNLNPQKCAPRTKPNLPERHFREIGSPAIEGISTAILEIMLTPIPPEIVIRSILNLTLLRESHYVGVSALTIHAVGLLISSLPPQAFLRPVFEEMNQMIMMDPSLLEVSEPCRLIRCSVPKRANGKYVMSQSLPDLTTTAVLKDSMSARFRKAMMFPYIFNDYTFNLHNYSTNVPNTFLTLFHSILHYSSLDGFTLFLEYLRSLRLSGKLQTDVQLLYVCFLLGPALHRIEKLETTDAEFMIELMNIVKQVTGHMDMKDGWVTQALEQVFDFLYHIRARFVKSPELAAQLKTIIKAMNPPISQRLLRLVM